MEAKSPKIFDRKSFNIRQLVIWSSFFVGLIAASLISGLVSYVANIYSADIKTTISLSMIIQDLLVFLLPAFIAARVITNRPATFLKLNTAPSWKAVLFTLLTFVISMPAMNYIVAWNSSISLPDSMQAIEQWMRATEQAAQEVTEMFLHHESFLAMIGGVLLVGVLTGFSEEMFFRGGLQGIFTSQKINAHISIWFVAIMFSVLHFQFFGFVPRMLLGALFGYMTYWSGTLWTAIIAHALNNSAVVVSSYLPATGAIGSSLDNLGVPADGSFPNLAVISLILTGFLIAKHRYFFGR